MSKRNLLASLLLSASLAGCAANPADNVPKAGVNTPSAGASPVAAASIAPTPGASVSPGVSATPAVSGTPSAAAGAVLAFVEGTEVKFKGSKVTGAHEGGFRKVSGSVVVPDSDLTKATIDVNIDMTSTYSDDEKLTGHLTSPDFFDTAKFPTSTFKSTAIAKTDDGYLVTGDLNLHGVTKSINFPAQIDLNGNQLGARAEFSINRKDFSIVYPGKPDDLIRDEVVILFDLKASGG
jgi:polyisoprenoid-binding protein YceI